MGNQFYKYACLLITSLLLSISIPSHTNAQEKTIDSLISALEVSMELRDFYDEKKEIRIEGFKALLNENDLDYENTYYLTNKLIGEYQYYSFDLALFYIEKNIATAEKIGDNFKVLESNLKLTKLLVETGRYKEAVDALDEMETNKIPKRLLSKYFYSLQEAYAGLSYYTEVQESKEKYSELYRVYEDSLTKQLLKSEDQYLRLKEKNLRDQRKLDDALEVNNQRIASLEMGNRLFSVVTFERSLLYELAKDTINQKKYLILSAQSDIIASVKDNASMTVLAMLLFQENEVEKAHEFINFSVTDAEFFNSRLRYVNISNILSLISKAYEKQTIAQNEKLRIFLSLLIVFGLILLVFLYFIIQQVKRLATTKNKLKTANNDLKQLNRKLNITNDDLKRLYDKLSESDKIKENYIGTFLNLYSDYINKLDSYRKLVQKYIITNKTKSLLDLTKSKQVIDEELNIFYKNFDESFLHIYPNFIEEVNKFLEEEEKILISNEHTLNTELRILALIRLGITDSARISKILRYSVNTIYNYRVKLKNKAKIERNLFEKEIKNIN
jgi:DNA-binding CsgD family transcriptional regulator